MTPAVVFIAEAADILRVSRRTLERWLRSGTCPLQRVRVGQRWAFTLASINDHLAHAGQPKLRREGRTAGAWSSSPAALLPSSVTVTGHRAARH